MARPNKKYKDLLEYMPANPTLKDIEERVQTLYEHYKVDDKFVAQIAKLYADGLKKELTIDMFMLVKQQCLIIKMAKDLGIPAFLSENVSNKLRKIANDIDKLVTFAKITTWLNKGETLTNIAMNKFHDKSPDALKKEYQRFKKSPIIKNKFYNKKYLQEVANTIGLNVVIEDDNVKQIGNFCMENITKKQSYKEFAKYKDLLKGKKNTGNYVEQLILEALSNYKF